MTIPTDEEIDAAKVCGGWTRKTLEEWGVPWPPPKGWRDDLRRKREGQDNPAPSSRVDSIRAGLAAGKTLREIGESLGVSPPTVSRLAKANAIPTNSKGRGRRPANMPARIAVFRERVSSRTTPQDLLAWRSERRWTQDDLANALGVTRRTYQHMENGDTRGGLKTSTVSRLTELAIKGLDAELLADKQSGEGHARESIVHRTGADPGDVDPAAA